ncbi:hypothetical protein TNCV_3135791 [Trichonephila clavipes]|nr:hypothetical protein TNCV_3135791 [Trichonephila clavipes]
MGETGDSDLVILELKLLLFKAYLEDEEFVYDFLDTMIEDRMKKEYRKREEEYRKNKNVSLRENKNWNKRE